MSEPDRRTGAWAEGWSVVPVSEAGEPTRPACNRCGFPVRSKVWGCKNPCPNCGTVYPLGDCSD